METKANYVAVGAFVLACMLALVVTVLWLAGVQYSQEYVYYQTKFTGSVSGLGKGTTVVIRLPIEGKVPQAGTITDAAA